MRKYLMSGLVIGALVVAVVLAWFFLKDEPQAEVEIIVESNPVQEDPLDITIDFYNSWLEALQSTTTNPYRSGLIDLPILSAEVRSYIEEKHTSQPAGVLEPVLCQSATPKRVGAKLIYSNETEAQIMVLTRGEEIKSPYQAIVTLQAKAGAWQIKSITCTQGEVAPVKEFDFEFSGFLLKESLLPPLDSQYWHLVYMQEEQSGYTVPLFFNAESMCTATDGSESLCATNLFREATKVMLQGDATEAGVVVRKMRFE